MEPPPEAVPSTWFDLALVVVVRLLAAGALLALAAFPAWGGMLSACTADSTWCGQGDRPGAFGGLAVAGAFVGAATWALFGRRGRTLAVLVVAGVGLGVLVAMWALANT